MKILKKISVKYHWMVLISIAILLAVFITVAFSQWKIINVVNEENEHTAQTNAQNATDQVSLYIENYETALNQYAQAVSALINKDSFDISDIDLITANIQQNSQYLAAYFMDFKTGKLHTSPVYNGEFNTLESSTYKFLNEKTELQWVDIYLDKGSNQVMTSVIAPVLKNGELVGAVGFDVSFSSIGDIRTTIEAQTDSKLMILDPNGLIVSSFIEGGDGKNVSPSNSGTIEGAEDLIELNELKEQFGWLNQSSNKVEQFTWDDMTYNGHIEHLDKNDWSIISLSNVESGKSIVKELRKVGTIAILIGLIIGCLVAYLLSAFLMSIFDQFSRTFERTASGDFVSRFETDLQNEIGTMANQYNKMLDEVQNSIQHVNENTEEIRQASNSLAVIAVENEQALSNVSNSIEEIAANTSQQTEKVAQGTEVIHELATHIEAIGVTSIKMTNEANEALHEVDESKNKVIQLEKAYENLASAFTHVNEVAMKLDEKTKSISNVTAVIASITEQTNLLALNASIEAARAGEHGKGFAVVAEEVRSLAESSKAATADIQQIIVTILDDTKRLVNVMDETNTISKDQKEAVKTVDHAINQLSQTLEGMMAIVEQTKVSVDHMQKQKDVVLTSMITVHEMSTEITAETQEIASTIEQQVSATSEVSSHSENLSNQVENLSNSVNKFTV